MKGNSGYRFLLTSNLLANVTLLFTAGTVFSEQTPKEARVTVVVHDVKLLPENKDPRAAEVNETVTEDTAVRTGDLSRSELTFLDLTITRLGSNTIFSFNKAGRSVHLNSGSILLRVPKNSGGANIKTDACSVAISGTVLILEANPDGTNRLAVLNGEARMSLNQDPDESETARGGQMLDVPSGAKKMPKPKKIDVQKIVNEHPLFVNFPPLPNEDGLYGGSDGDKSKSSGGNKTPQSPVVYNPPPPPGGSAPTGGAPIGPTGPIIIPTGPPYTGDHDHHPSHDGGGKTKDPKYPKDPKHADNPPKGDDYGDKPPKGSGHGKKKKKMPPDGGHNVNNDGVALPNGGGGGKVYKGRLPDGKVVGVGNANANANPNLGKVVGNKAVGQPVNANANAAQPKPTPRRKHKKQQQNF